MLNIALPKGRLGDKAYAMLEKAGFAVPGYHEASRKLVLEGENARYFLVKPTDVPIYVERGVADIGVVGLDTFLESALDLYELLDLRLGVCRLAVAGPRDFVPPANAPLRLATKYPRLTKDYYANKNMEIEIIKLHGSIELAPVLGLSDLIVDIVETGTTLKEHELDVLETIMPVSARLVANKAAYKFNTQIGALAEALKAQLYSL